MYITIIAFIFSLIFWFLFAFEGVRYIDGYGDGYTVFQYLVLGLISSIITLYTLYKYCMKIPEDFEGLEGAETLKKARQNLPVVQSFRSEYNVQNTKRLGDDLLRKMHQHRRFLEMLDGRCPACGEIVPDFIKSSKTESHYMCLRCSSIINICVTSRGINFAHIVGWNRSPFAYPENNNNEIDLESLEGDNNKELIYGDSKDIGECKTVRLENVLGEIEGTGGVTEDEWVISDRASGCDGQN